MQVNNCSDYYSMRYWRIDEEEELVEAFLLEAHLRLRGASRKAIRIEDYVEETVPRFNTK